MNERVLGHQLKSVRGDYDSMGSTLPEELRDAVAVIGLGLRFPGASSAGEYWRNLTGGIESITFCSREELEEAGATPTRHDSGHVPAFGKIDGHDLFDPGFFRFTPQEARMTDPQHRLLLICSWEALEDAGYGALEHDGPIGVFVGAAESTYYLGYDQVSPTGGSLEFLATRISYKLNLTGPSLSFQTACSTSLVCVHMAIRSLLDGECDMAVAGASSVRLPQALGHLYQEEEALSPDGHCRPFDARAQGTVAGNGVAAVVLKRLEDAWEDGDPIRAVILGSAVNNDGADRVDYAAPSLNGQAQVIAEALALARVDADSISYVETHGTGIPSRDLTEVQALHEVFRSATDQIGFCGLGSVKSNIGHLDVTAGLAGLIKTVLALEHRQLPPSLHFEAPNPEIALDGGPFYVNNQLRPWATEGPRRAGVSAFGIGGTNAHLVLEEAPPVPLSRPPMGPYLLVLSARSAAALEATTERLVGHFREHPDLELADVAYTLQAGRRAWPYRRIVVCQSLDEAVTCLEKPVAPTVRSAQVAPNAAPGVVFLFSGQGAQYVGMGRELYHQEPVFRQELDRCCDLLEPHLGRDLRELLYPATVTEDAIARLTETDVAQPALVAFEIALAKTWMAKGVRPAALIGHGVGEYAAAYLAGVFSLKDVLAMVVVRGKLMHKLGPGGMVAVSLAPDEIPERPGLSVAAIDTDTRTVVSGPLVAIEALEAELRERKVTLQRLGVSHAFHSEMMEPVLEPFARQMAAIDLSAPEIPVVSNLTGEVLTADEASDPGYWCRHLRETVCFAAGVRRVSGNADRMFLEIGPGNSLTTCAGEIVGDYARAFPALEPERNPGSGDGHLLTALGRLWLAGVPIDWRRIDDGLSRRRLSLPTTALDLLPYRLRTQARETAPHAALTTPTPSPEAELAAAASPPAAEAAAPTTQQSTLELILNDQLQVMAQQLELLRLDQEGSLTPGLVASDVATSDATTPEVTAPEVTVPEIAASSSRGFEIPAEVAATHRDLSHASYRFLEYVFENPSERGRPIDHRVVGAGLEDWIQRVSFDLQSWPTFLGQRKRSQVRQAGLTVTSLVRSVYERVFDNDPARIAEFHAFESPRVAEFLTAAPNGLENCLVRCDFTDSQRGFKCLEVNASGSISGWQHLFWEEILRTHPVIAEFIEREGIDPRYCDVLEAFLAHVADDCRARNLLEDDHLNLAMANEPRAIAVTRQAAPRLNRLAAPRLRRMGLTGTLFVCTMADLEVRGSCVYLGSNRIHAIHQTDFLPTPRDVMFCQKSAGVVLYNTPLAFMLGDKRHIGLLSEHADSRRFSAAERAAIRKYIPWTRRLQGGAVTFEGREAEISELLVGDPERFVIKKGLGSGGLDVYIGQYTPRDEWTTRIAAAVEEGDWIVQEFLPYRPYFFQGGESGATLHHAVYGVFCFGDHYGGCFLRTREPGDCGGVINSTRGAIESLVLEVDDRDVEDRASVDGEADLDAAIAATHADLSPSSRRFIDQVRTHPEMSRRPDYQSADLPAWLKYFTYDLQAWPIFVNEPKLSEIRGATLAVTRLVRSVYAKIFDNDIAEIAKYFEVDNELTLKFLLESPNGIASSMARCDFIDTGQGFQCLEVNMSANIGGWQLTFWEKICRSQPAIQGFIDREGIEPVYHDLLETLFEQILNDCRQHQVLTDGHLVVALITETQKVEAARPAAAVLNERFREWLRNAAPELDGEFCIGAFSDDLRVQAGDVTLGASRVHCLLNATDFALPQEILMAFKQRRTMLYNTPPAALLSDKRLIALLSENADSPRFSPEEREAIQRYIPWTRTTGERSVTFEGRDVPLFELLVAERERFVLKAASGAGGEKVHVGRSTPPERWRKIVRATASGDWIAQEFLTSRPYLFQSGEQGHAPHDAVWGLFCFGDRYAGGFLRIMPCGEGDGVLNAARGASEAFIYEV